MLPASCSAQYGTASRTSRTGRSGPWCAPYGGMAARMTEIPPNHLSTVDESEAELVEEGLEELEESEEDA